MAAARIGAARLGQRLRTPSPQAQAEHEAAVGRILFGALGQLRGTALKVSQLLSMHPTLLPEGVRRALARTDLPLPADRVVDSVMDEIEATLLREVNYLQEAEQLQWFAEHAALPGVAMARPLLSHTRAHVLTQQYLPGLHLDAWLATQPQQALRDRAGQHLWDWFMHCIFGLGRVHADPHPGNFLFAADGTVGVLDFGCTRELSEDFRTQMARAWSALLRPAADPQRDALVLQAYQALGLAGPDLALAAYSTELAPALADMQAWQLEPFTQAVFDFSTKQPPPHHAPGAPARAGPPPGAGAGRDARVRSHVDGPDAPAHAAGGSGAHRRSGDLPPTGERALNATPHARRGTAVARCAKYHGNAAQ